MRALVLAAAIPHLAASVVNIAYNSVQIGSSLNDSQQAAFLWLIVGYNLLAYPACLGTGIYLMLKMHRGLQKLARATGPEVDELRTRVRRFGWWTVALGSLGWFPGGLAFPLVIDLAAGGVGPDLYAHYLVSFTLAGLVGVVFCYLTTEYVVFRSLLPRLGNPDTFSPAAAWEEVRPLTAPFGPFLILACIVPLTGAVLLVVLSDGYMSLGFRLLVAALIGLGVAGVGIAERLTRKLRSLAAVWHRDADAA
jgi:hypothetical protein